eukprot:3079029-Rhodomonas_salina.2
MLRHACGLSILLSLIAASGGFSSPHLRLRGQHHALSLPSSIPTLGRNVLQASPLQLGKCRDERVPDLVLRAGKSVVSGEQANYQRNRKLINKLKKARDAEAVFSLLDEILEAEEAPPSLHAYTSALSACMRYGGHADVVKLLERMDAQVHRAR